MTAITSLGGGHGLFATLRAVRRIADEVTAVVTVADDGGSSGRLRRELGMAMSLRYTPELQFTADDSIEYGAHILEMLRDPTKVKPANPANEHIVLDGEEE